MPLSSSQASFKLKKQKDSEKADSLMIKNLKNNHFHLGDGGDYFKTSSSQLGLKRGEPGKMNKDIVNEIRSTHFKIGADPLNFLSSNHKDYQKHHGEKVKIDHSRKKDLMKTHFKIGKDKNNWKSEQKGNFNWIQPIPDKEFKLTLI